MEHLPKDLIDPPKPLIGVLGSQEETSFLFNQCFLHLNFIELEKNYKPKQRKSKPLPNSENYHLNGLLKSNWINKKLDDIPSLILYPIKRSQIQPNEIQIAHQINLFSNNCKQRNIKIIVLVLSDQSVTDNDEISQELFKLVKKKKADFDAKQISFFIHCSDNVSVSNQKLLLQMKDSYTRHYKETILYRQKIMKKNFSKKTQSDLFVRFHFKAGFYSEIIKDYKSTLKHYTSGYNYLCETPKTYFTSLEMKTVATLLMVKIIQLQINIGNIPECFIFFNKHMDSFKNYISHSQTGDLENYYWKWHQHKIFADLLSKMSVEQIINASGYWNGPWFHYYASAMYLRDRKNQTFSLAQKFEKQLKKMNLTEMKSGKLITNFLFDLNNSLYIGRPSWIIQKNINYNQIVSSPREKIDSFKNNWSSNDLLFLISVEQKFPYSTEIVNLLNSAFKSYCSVNQKSQRFLITISSGIAREYCSQGMFQFAKKFFIVLTNHFRKEKQNNLLSISLLYLAECSLQLLDYPLYVSTALELCNPSVLIPLSTKLKLQEKIEQLLIKETFKPPEIFQMNDQNIHSKLLKLEIQFLKPFSYLNTPIIMKFRITSNFPKPLSIDKIKLSFNVSEFDRILINGKTNNKIIEGEYNNEEIKTSPYYLSNLLLQPNEPKEFIFEWIFNFIKKIQIKDIKVICGNEQHGITFQKNSFPINQKERINPKSFPNRISTHIRQPPPSLHTIIKAKSQVLLGEYLPVSITIASESDHVTEGHLLIYWRNFVQGEIYYQNPENKLSGNNNKIPFKEIKPNNSIEIIIFIRALKVSISDLMISATYNHKLGYTQMVKNKESFFFIDPIQTKFQFYSKSQSVNNEKINKLNDCEDFFLDFALISIPPFPIKLNSIDLKLLNDFGGIIGNTCQYQNDQNKNNNINNNNNNNNQNRVKLPQTREKGERFQTLYQIRPKSVFRKDFPNEESVLIDNFKSKKNEKLLSIGEIHLQIERVRTENEKQKILSFWSLNDFRIPITLKIPKILFTNESVTIQIEKPSEGVQGELLNLTYRIVNHCETIQKIHLQVDHSACFLFSGFNHTFLDILPRATRIVNYKIVPLKPGLIPLPPIKILNWKTKKPINETLKNFHIFISPPKSFK
ncbi:trafficking protein particle complex subunit 11 [Anaeramoeba flamelloides]|uniref:Trafficking protein particle complex subunit 11 n=1 Tax=Anaeramoeba flamelloides TaxID=1746091 RepID=A0ABQ8XA81_9EUKA|nr:trafficking protein particle complex subunit 11 [Anaeramoeba flamelloides]